MTDYIVPRFCAEVADNQNDGGKMPETAEDLERELTQRLLPEERNRISVCVVDCTGKKTGG